MTTYPASDLDADRPLPQKPAISPATPNGYRLLAVVILLVLTVPRMAQRGMFVDGVTYAAISRNLSIGVGSLWAPVYTETFYATFFEQPPLGFALQATAFLILGDHSYVERAYSIVVLLTHAMIIGAIWRRVLPSSYDWLPLLYWVLPAVVTWAAINNMLENTQSLLTSGAVYALLRGRDAPASATASAWGAVAALMTVGATLVKGPVGLFPLAVPAVLPLLDIGRRRRGVRWAGLLVGLASALCVVTAGLLLYDAPREALQQFTKTHLEPALTGTRGDVWSFGRVTRHLVLGILSRLAAAVMLVWLIRRRPRPGVESQAASAFWFFLATAALASLPILVSQKLAGHYFLASVPFFSLAAAALSLRLIASPADSRVARWHSWAPIAMAATLAVVAALVLTLHGTLEPRDRQTLSDLDAVSALLPAGTTVGTCEAPTPDWGLVAYGQRLHRLSLAPGDRPRNGWFLLRDGACRPPANCAIAAAGASLQLYRCP